MKHYINILSLSCIALASLFGNKIESSEIKVVSQQIRIHNTVKTRFVVFVASNMIIEDCHEIEIQELKQ